MSKMSELYLDRQQVEQIREVKYSQREEMYESPEISAQMAVRDLMSAIYSLSKIKPELVRIEADDIELAYIQLEKMLSNIRK